MSSNTTLRVAVLTRTGRVSGLRMAEALQSSRHELCGVLAEKRSSMIRKMLRRRTLSGFIRQHGFRFLVEKLFEGVKGALQKTTLAPSPELSINTVSSLNAQEAVDILKSWSLDLIVVANAPILKKSTFSCSRLGAVNFHSGRLPEYGGLESEFWALYEKQQQAWATFHVVTEGLDSGSILREVAIDIDRRDDPDSLHLKLVEAGQEALIELCDELAAGGKNPVRDPGPAQLRPWPTPAERRELQQQLG